MLKLYDWKVFTITVEWKELINVDRLKEKDIGELRESLAQEKLETQWQSGLASRLNTT